MISSSPNHLPIKGNVFEPFNKQVTEIGSHTLTHRALFTGWSMPGTKANALRWPASQLSMPPREGKIGPERTKGLTTCIYSLVLRTVQQGEGLLMASPIHRPIPDPSAIGAHRMPYGSLIADNGSQNLVSAWLSSKVMHYPSPQCARLAFEATPCFLQRLR